MNQEKKNLTSFQELEENLLTTRVCALRVDLKPGGS